ncbi:hypothetical protein M899_2515 [Bacteriovorax sp. BSW11_IV]|uniref:hypothetical protein n=1 Tax=Bacteriovorax sp. BSW11_IV TaxID=1353529 RepID=UPI00038A3614|nr:hypothetical protein [Bacteriovorax sp. BSW11_IV]EQC50376.1 hypothetical protein M899_2515 [Bacteriovorax sp. BSW11_IV]
MQKTGIQYTVLFLVSVCLSYLSTKLSLWENKQFIFLIKLIFPFLCFLTALFLFRFKNNFLRLIIYGLGTIQNFFFAILAYIFYSKDNFAQMLYFLMGIILTLILLVIVEKKSSLLGIQNEKN